VRSPLKDDYAFTDLFADAGIYCLPGSVFNLPGFFRISLTASNEMIEGVLVGYKIAIEKARFLK
jgi:aspartate aminotransferase